MLVSCLVGAGNQTQHEILREISISLGPIYRLSKSQIERHSVPLEYLLFCQACYASRSTSEVSRARNKGPSLIVMSRGCLGWV